jgi:hypothetical protein
MPPKVPKVKVITVAHLNRFRHGRPGVATTSGVSVLDHFLCNDVRAGNDLNALTPVVKRSKGRDDMMIKLGNFNRNLNVCLMYFTAPDAESVSSRWLQD